MKLTTIMLVLVILAGSFIFARGAGSHPRVEVKKVKNEYNIVKNITEYNDDKKLDRKRVHKRRRKIRKPVKGLR